MMRVLDSALCDSAQENIAEYISVLFWDWQCICL